MSHNIQPFWRKHTQFKFLRGPTTHLIMINVLCYCLFVWCFQFQFAEFPSFRLQGFNAFSSSSNRLLNCPFHGVAFQFNCILDVFIFRNRLQRLLWILTKLRFPKRIQFSELLFVYCKSTDRTKSRFQLLLRKGLLGFINPYTIWPLLYKYENITDTVTTLSNAGQPGLLSIS